MVKNYWKYHIILWLIVIFLGYLTDFGFGGFRALNYGFSAKGLRVDFVFYTSSILIYYLNFKYVCPVFLKRKRPLLFYFAIIIGVILLAVVLFACIRFVLDEVVFKYLTGDNNYKNKSLRLQFYYFDNLSYALKALLYSTITFLIFRFINVKNQIFQLQLDHKKAELDFLKSQISPHFLYNTLNTFYSELMLKQPETAKDILKLSKLLRYVTYETKSEFIELKKEIGFINDYIYFYKKRFEDQLFVNFKVVGTVKDHKILSLVLMHFIENVFKHGVLNDETSEANIEIEIRDTEIQIMTNNKFDTVIKYMDSGIGMKNLKRRLTNVYGSTYHLDYKSEGTYFKTYLKLPL